MALEMNTISKSQSTSPSSMRVNIPSSDESTSPPWHAWELEAPTSADEPWRQDQPDSGTPFSPLVDNSMSDAPKHEGAILNFAGTSELAQIYKEYNSHGYGQLAHFVLLGMFGFFIFSCIFIFVSSPSSSCPPHASNL